MPGMPDMDNERQADANDAGDADARADDGAEGGAGCGVRPALPDGNDSAPRRRAGDGERPLFDTAGAAQDAEIFEFASPTWDNGQRAEIKIMQKMCWRRCIETHEDFGQGIAIDRSGPQLPCMQAAGLLQAQDQKPGGYSVGANTGGNSKAPGAGRRKQKGARRRNG